MTSSLVFVPAAILVVLALNPVAAQAADAGETAPAERSPANNDRTLIGAGALIYKSPFRGEDSTVLPVPVLSVRRGALYLESLEAGVSLPLGGSEDRGPSVQAFVAARAIAGEDREGLTADGGARATLATPIGTVSLDYRRDLSGKFDGGEWAVRYEVSGEIGALSVTSGVQANRQDRKTANYMYGVDIAQRRKMIKNRPANARLAAYEIEKSTTNLSADITVVLQVTDRLFAIGHLSGAYLGEPVRQSPWIGRDYEAQSLVGLAYSF